MKLKQLIRILFLITILLSCKSYKHSDLNKTLIIKELSDSTDAVFTELFIFEKGKPVIDTFADIDGRYTILLSKKIRKIAFRNADDYPLILRRSQLLKKEKIYLRSVIFKKSGDSGYDKLYYKKEKKLLVELLLWNHKASVDSVSFGIDHPNDIFHYKELNFFKTKVKGLGN